MAEHLSRCGHQIILGTRSMRSEPNWLPLAEIAVTDWENSGSIQQACRKVDLVIHAAGLNAQDCAAAPVLGLYTNGVVTARLAEAASRAGVRRIVFLSTAHVYSSPLTGTITEHTCPRNLHPYATSNLAGENAVLAANAMGIIEGTVLRLANAYGAPTHPDTDCWKLLINDLCRQAVENRQLILQSSGAQERDFLPIFELCRAIENLVLATGSDSQTGVINVCTGRSQSVREVAVTIQERCVDILGFRPDLKVQAHRDKLVAYHSLNYNSVRADFYKINSDPKIHKLEIDRLLQYTDKVFGKYCGIR